MYPIWKNGKEAYALQCPTCGNEYSMYVYKFRQMYIGHTTPNGGRINPTHGTKSIFQAMDRKAREGWNNIPKNTEHHLVDELHLMTHEEYQSMHEKRRKQEAKNRREYEQRMMEYLEKEDEKRMKEESLTRKELIEKGIIKYKKGIGLVNTQTGEIIKL